MQVKEHPHPYDSLLTQLSDHNKENKRKPSNTEKQKGKLV